MTKPDEFPGGIPPDLELLFHERPEEADVPSPDRQSTGPQPLVGSGRPRILFQVDDRVVVGEEGGRFLGPFKTVTPAPEERLRLFHGLGSRHAEIESRGAEDLAPERDVDRDADEAEGHEECQRKSAESTAGPPRCRS